MSVLFSPIALRNLVLPNRIVVSPMCQYSAEQGLATDWHIMHLGALAMSGAAMLFIEATAVESAGRITPGCLGIWDEDRQAAIARVVAAIRRYSNIRVAVQLAHAGRKASSDVPWEGGQQIPIAKGGWEAVAPSAVPHKEGELPPRELDAAGLERIRKSFAAAARRAAALGLDAIEIHSAHGYLLHEFLSPVSNRRTDEYGGSLANRMRYPLEVFETVRAAFPADKPMGVRLSATDWVEGGWDLEQSVAYAIELKKRGADWIDVSSGGVSPLQKIPVTPGYQVPFAKAIRAATGLPTVAVGLITEPQQAEEIIARGEADMVALARGMLYDPRWAWHAAAKLGGQVSAPPPYWRAPPREQKDLFGEIINGGR
ncbi:MAG: NADH:flavin oxidoreductase/NADH oxidase [Proteobacteria bacterium]|nr:NADH:flavin oxidoreductase/NADH oxidase [Pseudomonadota bacterium]